MKFLLDDSSDVHAIQRYDEGRVTIRQTVYQSSLIVLPDRIITDWAPTAVDQLKVDDFHLLAKLGLEIVILGTGRLQRFPHPALTQPLMQQRIGFEIMDTPAACRTYNILVSEGRRVAAALFMI
jgi:uncharacterized protein